MAIRRPVLFLGPRPSHVSDLLDAHAIGLHVSHGDVDATAEAAVKQFRDMPDAQAYGHGRPRPRGHRCHARPSPINISVLRRRRSGANPDERGAHMRWVILLTAAALLTGCAKTIHEANAPSPTAARIATT